MITDQETIKKTKSLGLNTYEVKIWTALLSRGISTAGELSDIANVPRSRSYDVLESLDKKGFVIMKPGKPIKYIAVPPKEALERVRENIKINTEKHISIINNQSFNNLINNLQKIYESNNREAENIIAVLKGRNNIQKHIEFLFKNTDKDILVSTENSEDGTFNKTKDNLKDIKIKTLNKGIRLCVTDDNIVLFPISKGDTHPDYDLGIWIKNKKTSDFIKKLIVSF